MGNDTVLSAGICDTCSIPKMMTIGNGINEPPDHILYCDKKKCEICPEPPENRMVECQFYTFQKYTNPRAQSSEHRKLKVFEVRDQILS